MTLNDLECAIHLKVRLVDGTLIRIGVTKVGEGEGLEGLAPSMWATDALFLCGS